MLHRIFNRISYLLPYFSLVLVLLFYLSQMLSRLMTFGQLLLISLTPLLELRSLASVISYTRLRRVHYRSRSTSRGSRTPMHYLMLLDLGFQKWKRWKLCLRAYRWSLTRCSHLRLFRQSICIFFVDILLECEGHQARAVQEVSIHVHLVEAVL
ncbi:hypothetical protein V6Z11_D06G185600 [Gossypium hirsutum]